MADLANLPFGEAVPVFTLRHGRPCTIDRRGEYDAMGRCQFFLNWDDDGKKRGQVFFARPDKHVSVAQVGSLWKHKVTGAVFRVEEAADGGEYLMGVERLSKDDVNEVTCRAREFGIDEQEAIDEAKACGGFMVEPAWFEHAAVKVKTNG